MTAMSMTSVTVALATKLRTLFNPNNFALGFSRFFPQNSNFSLGLVVQRTCLVVMAVIVRKSFSSMSSLIFKHSHAQNSCSFSLSRFGARYNSSVSSTGKFQVSPFISEDGAGIDNQGFLKWHNGGGIFHKSASVDPTAFIEIGAIVHSKCVLGADVHLGSGTVIGPAVIIGQSTKIAYNAALSNCSVGDSCVIHSGVCIGQDGFGFFVDDHGNVVKKPQMLNAMIGRHVEIGANTCIDRGSWRDTVIGDHTKIDNLVQIGHNVIIGKSCMLCGQVGIAGSVTIGDYVTLGGRVAVRDHVSIASKVRLAANSCVTKDIREPGDYGGFPAVPINKWRRQVAIQCRISSKGRT